MNIGLTKHETLRIDVKLTLQIKEIISYAIEKWGSWELWEDNEKNLWSVRLSDKFLENKK